MLYYIDSGGNDSLPTLFLHGLGTNADSWHFQFTSLPRKGYRVIAPDLPGFGRSAAGAKHWSIRSSAEQAVDLMDKLGIPGCIAAGVSLGGTVAIQMALQYPDRIRGLILINTFANLKPKSPSEWGYFIRRGVKAFIKSPSNQARIVAERVFPEPEQSLFRELLVQSIQNTDPKVYRSAMIELVRFDAANQLSQIKMPTLVVTGADDTTIPLAAQKEMADSIPGAIHAVIPRAGHGVMVDQPEEFNQWIIGFLAQFKEVEPSNPVNS